MTYIPDKYAVLGNPVAHSRSPQIHRAFAAQTGADIHYDRILVPVNRFVETAKQFIAAGGRGFNVTVPCKEDAYRFAGRLTPRALRAKAVNTVVVNDNGPTLGDNTDGAGLVKDLVDNLGWPLTGKRVLILGAGGAVRGVLEPVLNVQPAAVVLANRTATKASILAAEFADLGPIQGGSYDELANATPFDLIINGTSASLAGALPPVPGELVNSNCCCYDMMYGPQPTVFMAWAQATGAGHVADGLGMLVEQAAESFALWRGTKPDTRPVIATIRTELGRR
tara:strand:+ start:12500 stop:13342 length:843 start_codon:yes stop_codon:yes gene_type:complete